MGFRFYRRVRILPGLSANFSRSGPILTAGVWGAHEDRAKRVPGKGGAAAGTFPGWTGIEEPWLMLGRII